MAGLFDSLGLGIRGIQATSVSIQTAGHNIANANTEGYTRQRVELTAVAPEEFPFGFVGNGVEVTGIERVIDEFIEGRLREENAELESLTIQESSLIATEAVFNELGESDLSSALNDFFQSLEDLANDPGSATARQQVVQQALALSDLFNVMEDRINDIRSSLDDSLETSVDQANQLIAQIAQINQKISEAERGGDVLGVANDLRDQRGKLMLDLAKLIEYRAFEQSNGQVNISVGGQFLVFGTDATLLDTEESEDRGIIINTVVFASNQRPVALQGGELEGITRSRDTLLGGVLDDMNGLAGALIFEVNKIHAAGTGLTGFSTVTGDYQVADATSALDQAGLDFTPRNGSFDILVRNENTGIVTSFTIEVDLDGIGTDTALSDATGGTGLVELINAAVGAVFPDIVATATATNRLRIESNDGDFTFGFANDTSNALAALGINTLFSGVDANDISVNSTVQNDLDKVAAGRRFVAGDNANALDLAALRTEEIAIGTQSTTLGEFYQGIVGELAVNSASAQDLVSVQKTLVRATEAERQSVSGVSLDEEAIDLITNQRVFQGLARYVTIIDELLDVLINAT